MINIYKKHEFKKNDSLVAQTTRLASFGPQSVIGTGAGSVGGASGAGGAVVDAVVVVVVVVVVELVVVAVVDVL